MDLVQLTKDLQQLESDIAEREKRITFYEKWGVRPDEHNFSYVFNFQYGGAANVGRGPAAVQLPLQQNTLQVKKDTIFLVKSITQAFTVVGTAAAPVQAATLTLPRSIMLAVFAYRFKIRDTGSDREWQNDWVNGAMLLSGNYNGFRLRRGHSLCSPGSEITIQVDAKSFGNNSDLTRLTDIQSQELQIVLSGFEIPFAKGML